MNDYPTGQRIDAPWPEPAIYPEHVSIRLRFQDLDRLGPVNNVTMAALFEDARPGFNHPMGDPFQTDMVRTMVAGQTLNDVNECHMCPDLVRPDLDFQIGIGRIGRSSWVMQACAWQDEPADSVGYGDTGVHKGWATLPHTEWFARDA